MSVLADNDFCNGHIQLAAQGLGLCLMAVGFYSEYQGRKAHFAFTYLLLGSNLALLPLAITLVEAAVDEDSGAVLGTGLLMLLLCAGLIWYARRTQSYWFLVLAAGYAYVAVCGILSQVLLALPHELVGFGLLVFFPLSAVAMVLFFVNIKKLMRYQAPSSTGPVPPASF
jgi:hypothetical protein